ncbi:MAP kinase kinase (MEK) [Didymella keratinophila]|nr:MAP kinase kinase (MEK) [Didymella keratinophila]
MADPFAPKTMKRKNKKGLALSAPPPKPVSSESDAQAPGGLGNAKEETLEIGVEFQLDLKAEDLIVLRELGSGNGGTVSKVQHAATKVIMARKVIHVEAKNEVRKRIVRELRIMHECNSPYIVDFYGAFQNDSGDVIMCMEYMDVGALDWVSRQFGPRIQGSPYTVKSDVWSVGLSIMELAIGKFPFSGSADDDEAGGPQGILDLLQQIVLEPAPKLPKSDAFPSILEDMVAKCLLKDPKERPTPKELYDHDAFLQAAKRTPVDLEAWATSMLEHNKRKSHLAPSVPSGNIREKLQNQEPAPRRGSADVRYQESSSRRGSADVRQDGSAPPRPAYPQRTSSSISHHSQSNSQSSVGGQMSLPMRPAPPASNGSNSRPQSRGPPLNGGLPPAPRRMYSDVQ